jgi:hypothetical protein
VVRRDWHLTESLSLGCPSFPAYRFQFRASQTADRYLAIPIFPKFQSRLTTKIQNPGHTLILVMARMEKFLRLAGHISSRPCMRLNVLSSARPTACTVLRTVSSSAHNLTAHP